LKFSLKHDMCCNFLLNNKAFHLQNKVISIIALHQERVSYENIICKVALPIAKKYLLALITFIIDKVEVFQTSAVVYTVCTRHKHNLHRPVANLWSLLC